MYGSSVRLELWSSSVSHSGCIFGDVVRLGVVEAGIRALERPMMSPWTPCILVVAEFVQVVHLQKSCTMRSERCLTTKTPMRRRVCQEFGFKADRPQAFTLAS